MREREGEWEEERGEAKTEWIIWFSNVGISQFSLYSSTNLSQRRDLLVLLIFDGFSKVPQKLGFTLHVLFWQNRWYKCRLPSSLHWAQGKEVTFSHETRGEQKQMWGTIILQTKCCGLFFTVLGGGGLVTKSCLTLVTPMDCSPLGFSVHGTLQARILEWVTISFSRASSWPRSPTLQMDSLPTELLGKPFTVLGETEFTGGMDNGP